MASQDHITPHSGPSTSQPNHPNNPHYTITPVRTPQDLEALIALFTTDAASLSLDLSFQDFQAEMASMPGKYASERGGELLLARGREQDSDGEPRARFRDGTPLGCVPFRPLPQSSPECKHVCEMKHLYVSPQARGLGLGRALEISVLIASVGDGLRHDQARHAIEHGRHAEDVYRYAVRGY